MQKNEHRKSRDTVPLTTKKILPSWGKAYFEDIAHRVAT
jgi:hypothetical protein